MIRYIIGFVFLFVASISHATNEGLVIREDSLECLAKNIYFEARNQPVEGMYAVAYVTLNRVFSDRFPDSVCGVVTQYKQFSWYWDGKSDIPRDMASWKASVTIAKLSMLHYMSGADITGGSLFYHADYSRPIWRHKLAKVRQIGDHIFYR